MDVRQSAIALLIDWRAPNPAQDSLRHAVLSFLYARDDACRRDCAPGHVTASTLVLDNSGRRVLLTLHPRLGRWVQLGGHCEDADADIAAAALREATEESGVADLRLTAELAGVHVHPITCSLGVPTRHLDLQFVAHAPPGARIAVSDESVDLQWWPVDGLPDGSDAALADLVARASSGLL
ncbi:NUDIX domain-containing protein [Mycobacterium sp.]|uniref:NUDIX hydrolase n=1 Tax=Mycobacterium sp. TaxID=1785 RepID=UPI0031D3AAE9